VYQIAQSLPRDGRKVLSKEVSTEMKTKSQSNRKMQLAFGSAILAMLVVVAISYHSMVVSRESEQWVRHTHEVLENLQDLLSSMDRRIYPPKLRDGGVQAEVNDFGRRGKADEQEIDQNTSPG
jgi:hypothetical protein